MTNLRGATGGTRLWFALLVVLATACTGVTASSRPARSLSVAGVQGRMLAATADAPPVVGTTPRKLARRLTAAERVIRNDESSGRQLGEAGHLQQRAYRKLASRPVWVDKVLPRLPRWLRPLARRNIYAQRQLNALSSGPPPDDLPEWRIIEPEPRSALKRYYRKAQERFGVRWRYLAAINLVETRMGRIRGVSSAGAQGPMQFMPATWDIYGRGDIRDPHDAIMAAGRYLDARGAPNDMNSALYAYNNDVRYVRAVKAYAAVMRRHPVGYRGYYHWQVYYRQPGGAVWLPVGWDGT